MKRSWQGILICFFLLVLWGGWVSAKEYKGPIAVLEERVFDFHEVTQGVVAKHVFRVSNRGDQLLKIKKVTSPG